MAPVRRLAIVSLLVVSCGVVNVQAQTLKLAYKQGDIRTFAAHVVLNETIDLGSVSEPLKVDTTATETETVQSVGGDGVADVTVTLTGVTSKVSAAGQTSTTSPTLPAIEMKIAPDGRVLSANGLSFSGGSPFGSVGSNTSESAVLPDNPVKPGDTWTKTYDRANPIGSGTVHVIASSKYLRNEKVNGVQTAVINTKGTTPLDISIELAKYGQLTGSQLTALTSLGISGMTISGSDASDTTTWLDASAQRVQKTSVKVTIDATFAFVLAPGAKYPGPTGPFAIKGGETIDLVAT